MDFWIEFYAQRRKMSNGYITVYEAPMLFIVFTRYTSQTCKYNISERLKERAPRKAD